MKKYFRLMIAAAFLVQTFSSCNKQLLEKAPLDIVSDEAVWKDPILINAYITDLYGNAVTMDGIYWENWRWYKFADLFEEICRSDEARGCFDWGPETKWDQGSLDRTGGHLEYWDYKLVRSCNTLLEKITRATVGNDVKNNAIAHARFIRALVYFEMVKDMVEFQL